MLTEEHLCPACGVPMALRLRREVEGYDIPEEGHALDVFGMFHTVTLYLDLYTCPQCRRAEFFEADLAPEPEELASWDPFADLEPEENTDRPADPWEKGGLFRRKKDKPDWEGSGEMAYASFPCPQYPIFLPARTEQTQTRFDH